MLAGFCLHHMEFAAPHKSIGMQNPVESGQNANQKVVTGWLNAPVNEVLGISEESHKPEDISSKRRCSKVKPLWPSV